MYTVCFAVESVTSFIKYLSKKTGDLVKFNATLVGHLKILLWVVLWAWVGFGLYHLLLSPR